MSKLLILFYVFLIFILLIIRLLGEKHLDFFIILLSAACIYSYYRNDKEVHIQNHFYIYICSFCYMIFLWGCLSSFISYLFFNQNILEFIKELKGQITVCIIFMVMLFSNIWTISKIEFYASNRFMYFYKLTLGTLMPMAVITILPISVYCITIPLELNETIKAVGNSVGYFWFLSIELLCILIIYQWFSLSPVK